mmetsp:Transcript_7280/g.10839  ORF Transcript_7280/g.10839 Transcript_7280/m.10839 type:complete len:748 (-) Transcript_7280:82-2325(-)
MKLLPAGDMTEIGEKGVNLSGGQQQRVSLARAAYSSSEVVLLDDPLSAVDSHVGEHIFTHLIVGLLKDRTRVLVTHNLPLCVSRADVVICVGSLGKCNTVLFSCALDEVLSRIELLKSKEGNSCGVFLDGLQSAVSYSNHSNPKGSMTSPQSGKVSTPLDDQRDYSMKLSLPHMGSTKTIPPKQDQNFSSITVTETKAEGEVSFAVYGYYFKLAGGIIVSLALILASVWVSLSWLLQSYSLGKWMEEMESSQSHRGEFFSRYLGCIASVLVASACRALLQIFCSLAAARNMHELLLRSVMLSTCSWFDSTPIGRIINRFSQDITTIDSNTMTYLVDFLDCLLSALQIVIVISWCLPMLLLALIPIILFTTWVSYQYLCISRELKRLESVKKSPVFVLFSETLLGLPVIRAFQKQEMFFENCCEKVDEMNRCHLYLWISNRWLNFRMQVLGAFVAGIVGVAVVFEAESIGITAAGIVLTYSLGFCDTLTFLARMYADCQMSMNSVERVKEYSELESEKYLMEDSDHLQQSRGRLGYLGPSSEVCGALCARASMLFRRDAAPSFSRVPNELDAIEVGTSSASPYVPHNWPAVGSIEFKNISLQYKSAVRAVLNNVSFRVPGRKKVGIVGRTGAGKSSLVAALFRLVEPHEGSLLLDDMDVLHIPLNSLRSQLAIVPQDLTLFKGSVRFNFGPLRPDFRRRHLEGAAECAHGYTRGGHAGDPHHHQLLLRILPDRVQRSPSSQDGGGEGR